MILCNAVPSKALITQAALALIRADYGFTIVPEIDPPDDGIKFIAVNGSAKLSYGMFYKKDSLPSTARESIAIIKEIAIN